MNQDVNASVSAGRTATSPVLGTLARQEIGNYLRNRLFWFGTAVWLFGLGTSLTGSDDQASTVGDGLFPAASVGVLGIVVMATLVRSSDQAAAAGGAVAVPQRTRTLALAAAVVVPATMGLLSFVAAVIGYHANPPAPYDAPVGSIGVDVVYTQLFAQGVMSCIGGPLLGLVIGRWWPRRGAAPVLAVVIVVVTMVVQPLFTWAEHLRLAWVWIHFFAPSGIAGDPDRMIRHTGSPYAYIGYQATLCVLGVLVSLYADPEADRARLRRAVLAVAGVAAALVVLALVLGPHHTITSPIPSPHAHS